MAQNLPWLRLYAETVDDDNLRLLAFGDRWHYIALLCLKCSGVLDKSPETLERRVAVKLELPIEEVEALKQRLLEVDLIDAKWQPSAWNRRQHAGDSTGAERTRRWRAKEKSKGDGGRDVTGPSRSNVTASQRDGLDTDIDTDTEGETNTVRAEVAHPGSGFEEWWTAYPVKRAKKTAREVWRSKRLDSLAPLLVADVRRRLESDDRWGRGYIPNPTTYLRQERWTDDLTEPARPAPTAPRRTRYQQAMEDIDNATED